MSIIFLEVQSSKLTNRELSKSYDTLLRQKKLAPGHIPVKNNLQKANYVRSNHRYVTVRIPESKLEAFSERAQLSKTDINTVRGRTFRDLDRLEEELDSDDDLADFKYPAIKLDNDPYIDLNTSIRNAIRKMDNNPKNLEEGFGDMNLTLSIPAELEEQSPEYEEQPEEVIAEQSTDDSNQEWASLDLTQGPGELTQHTTTIGYEPNSAKNEEVLQVFMAEEENENKTDFKLDAGGSIPIWKTGNGQRENTNFTRTYIRDLRRIRNLKLIKNEALLINASLVKSQKTHLYEELPLEAESNIDKLIEYLQTAYGLTRMDLMRELASIRQLDNENPHTYMSRIITQYYEARYETKKSLHEVAKSEQERYEIAKLFIDGLADARVRVNVGSRLDTINFVDLPKMAKNCISALAKQEPEKVFAINRETRKCYRCKQIGHIARNCQE